MELHCRHFEKVNCFQLDGTLTPGFSFGWRLFILSFVLFFLFLPCHSILLLPMRLTIRLIPLVLVTMIPMLLIPTSTVISMSLIRPIRVNYRFMMSHANFHSAYITNQCAMKHARTHTRSVRYWIIWRTSIINRAAHPYHVEMPLHSLLRIYRLSLNVYVQLPDVRRWSHWRLSHRMRLWRGKWNNFTNNLQHVQLSPQPHHPHPRLRQVRVDLPESVVE